MPEVFIIHASADDALVTRIRDSLAQQTVDAWVDHIECGGARGDDVYEKQIHHALKTSQWGLFVLTSESVHAARCREQMETFLKDGKRLFIASLEALQLTNLPDSPYQIQFFDLAQNFDTGIEKIVQAAKRQYDPRLPSKHYAADANVSREFPRWHLQYPLIGRDFDLSAVQKALTDGFHSVSIFGMSGTGKTRLAVETVTTMLFQHGVIWMDMSQYSTLADLTTLIRNHFALDANASQDAVWATLNKRQVLLVLDGAEHCAQRSAIAVRLNNYDLAGGTRVLITSRHKWDELLDTKTHELRALESNIAKTLFQAMINRTRPNFSLEGYEETLTQAAHYRPGLMNYVLRWADTYPPDYILDLLRNLRVEEAEPAFRDLVLSGVEAVEQHPQWRDVPACLRRLAVCKGGFTFNAARPLISSPNVLQWLVKWGMATLDTPRYFIDPLLLATINPDDSAREMHFEYFLSFAEECDTKQDYVSMEADAGNFAVAFTWALGAKRYEEALRLANACSEFFFHRTPSDGLDARSWFERLAVYILPDPTQVPKTELQARVQLGLGVAYQRWIGGDRRMNLQRAQNALERALSYLTANRAPFDYAMIQNNLGITFRSWGEIEDHVKNLQRAVQCFERAKPFFPPRSAEMATLLSNLCTTYITLAGYENRKGNLWKAVQSFRLPLATFAPNRAPISNALALNNFGVALAEFADVSETDEDRALYLHKAEEHFERALATLTPARSPSERARTLNNLGNLFRRMATHFNDAERIHKAISYYSQAQRFWNPQQMPYQYATGIIKIGEMYMQLAAMEGYNNKETLKQAEAALLDGMHYLSRRKYVLDFGKNLMSLSVVYDKLKDKTAARQYAIEAEKLFRDMRMDDLADRIRRWLSGLAPAIN